MRKAEAKAASLHRDDKLKYASFIAIGWWIVSALLILSVSACSKGLSVTPTPLPPNLAALCQALPLPPVPLVDPERSLWEEMIITLYGDCAAKHKHTVEGVK